MTPALALLTLLVACKDDPPPAGGGPTSPTADTGASPSTGDTGLPEGCDTVSWELTGQPFVTSWCTSCHSSELAEGDRYGADVGIDFDTYDLTASWVSAIYDQVYVKEDMPPAGGISQEELDQFELWLECGLPGEPDAPPADCSGEEVLAVDELPASCLEPIAVTGDVVVDGDTDLPCVCAIDGDLTVTAGDVRFAALETVGGSVDLSGGSEVDVPALESVGADLTVTAPSLSAFEMRRLAAVGGEVRVEGAHELAMLPFVELAEVDSLHVEGNDGLLGVDLPRLETVAGTLAIRDNPALANLFGEAYALESVGGDFLLLDNPAWTGFYCCAYLEEVGGDLRIEGMGWRNSQGFTALGSVGGDLVVRDNPSLETLDGFDQLVEVGGDLEIADNPLLENEDAFDFLEVVGGTVRLVGNPQLTILYGLVLPSEVGGIEVGDNARLPGFGGFNKVTYIEGDVLLYDLPAALAVDGLHDVGSVGGDVTVRNLPSATIAVLLDDAENVGGSVVYEDLPLVDFPELLPRMRFVGGDFVQRRVGWSMVRTGPNFSQIGGSLVVEENPSMLRIDDLGSLSALGGLRVADNPVLTGVGGLDGVTDVTGDVELEGNPALSSLFGLGDLDTIDGNLLIDDNDALGSVLPLHGLSTVGGNLVITGNASLATADADALAAAIDDVEGKTTIAGNAP